MNYSFYSQIDSPFHKYTSRKKNAIDIYPILWKHLHNTYRQLVICLCWTLNYLAEMILNNLFL